MEFAAGIGRIYVGYRHHLPFQMYQNFFSCFILNLVVTFFLFSEPRVDYENTTNAFICSFTFKSVHRHSVGKVHS